MAIINEDVTESVWRRAAVVSLLTWRRAGADDALDDGERYGWWGDSFPTLTNDQIGSRLWQLRRRTLDADTVRDATTFAREALQWMLDDGRVVSVDIATTRSVDRLDMRVSLKFRDGASLDFSIDNLWQVIHAL
ncbi:phage GP46 family protein [Pseudomonas sp. O64]|jgi:phage gp46-like protein|uniref:phage GP46 family protein n=1 Tax=unclassified Pseudomonas TaxID=196821 RepID=UPI00387AFBDE